MKSMRTFCRAPILIVLVIAAAALATFGQAEGPVLISGSSVERDLKSGETHHYRISLDIGQYLRAVVDQQFFDVIIRLIAPDGTTLVEIDGPGTHEIILGTEELHFLSQAVGEYRLEVRPHATQNYPFGRYTLNVEELRRSTQADRDFLSALALRNEALRLRKNAGERSPDAVQKAAIEKHIEAAAAFRALNSTDHEIGELEEIGRIYALNLKDSNAGNEYFEKGLRLASEANNAYRAATINQYLAAAFYRAEQYDKSVPRYESAFTLYKQIDHKQGMWTVTSSRGNALLRSGDYDAALNAYEMANSLENLIPWLPRTVKGNIGLVHFDRGNFWTGLEFTLKAIDRHERFGNKLSNAQSSVNAGSLYQRLGNPDRALEYYRKAHDLFADLSGGTATGTGVGVTLSSMAKLLMERGENTEALRLLEKALEIAEKHDSKSGVSSHLRAIGQIHRWNSDYDKALQYFDRAAALNKDFQNKRQYIHTLDAMADVSLLRGKYDQAIKLTEESAEIQRKIKDFNWVTYSRMGEAYYRSDDLPRAREAFETAIAGIEKRLAQLSTDRGPMGYFAGVSPPYYWMVRLLVESGHPEDAFAYTEKAKARILLDTLKSGRTGIDKAMTGDERKRESEFKESISSLNSKITNETDAAKVASLEAELGVRRSEFEAFQTRLYALHPELRAQRGDMVPIDVKAAAGLLPDDRSVIIEYGVSEDRTYLFVISNDNGKPVLKAHTVQIDSEKLAWRTEDFRSKLASGDLNVRSIGRELYDLLLGPARSQIGDKKNLIIVPDGPLWDLPFQALLPDKNRYLIEQSAISYAPSSTALAEMKKRDRPESRPRSDLIAFGNPAIATEKAGIFGQSMDRRLGPLPEAERMATTLEQMYGPARSRILVGADAREEIAKRESSNYRIVQFAAHGVLNNTSPMYSYIVLAQNPGDGKEDGLLEAWEMKNLDLRADLVILSACETARGKISNGEGVIGMSWAMFIAGASATVASQWKVESSSTTELMLEFHRQMLRGRGVSKAEALRRASVKLLRTHKYKHPYNWAGFVLIGDGS